MRFVVSSVNHRRRQNICSGKVKMTKDKFIFVSDFPITKYKCGLKAGERVRLKKDLIVTCRNRPTGDVHRKGEVWSVLRGSKEGRIDVWFRQPDGQSHTWDDDAASIGEWFELIDESKKVRTRKSKLPRVPLGT